jgi:cytochrome c peroxidase
MHNGIFTNFNQIINLYNHGGGKGKGLQIDNQTLSSDSLHLSTTEINQIEAFIKTLNENIAFEKIPTTLPNSIHKKLNSRIVGGNY